MLNVYSYSQILFFVPESKGKKISIIFKNLNEVLSSENFNYNYTIA